MKACSFPWITTACIAVAMFGLAPDSHGGATASALGSFGDTGFKRDDDSNPNSARAVVTNTSVRGDSFDAIITVEGPTI